MYLLLCNMYVVFCPFVHIEGWIDHCSFRCIRISLLSLMCNYIQLSAKGFLRNKQIHWKILSTSLPWVYTHLLVMFEMTFISVSSTLLSWYTMYFYKIYQNKLERIWPVKRQVVWGLLNVWYVHLIFDAFVLSRQFQRVIESFSLQSVIY